MKCPTCGREALIKGEPPEQLAYCYNADCDRCAVLPLRTRRFSRYTDSGACDACGFDMYADHVTADTHAPDCPDLVAATQHAPPP